MSRYKLKAEQLTIDFSSYPILLQLPETEEVLPCMALQPRLSDALTHFLNPAQRAKFMFVIAKNSREYLSLFAEQIKTIKERFSTTPSSSKEKVADAVLFEQWCEQEQLFGYLTKKGKTYQLQPGLVHKAHGGVLILSINLFLQQPILWFRLKNMILTNRYTWYAQNKESIDYPSEDLSTPLELQIVLVGQYDELSNFQNIDDTLYPSAFCSVFEYDLDITEQQTLYQWCAYVRYLCQHHKLPSLQKEVFPLLIKAATRYSDSQYTLPLSPEWISRLLLNCACYVAPDETHITPEHFQLAQRAQHWHESSLLERYHALLKEGVLRIDTQGSAIGQINALAVSEYSGYPISIGEVFRISCVVHLGDGEINDVERKAELGGNLHAKSMMIMQAFITSQLTLKQPIPFSASIVFEQNYDEIDGDSASLAGLCALFSALSMRPINQQFAVTGSVDQFGYVQAIGGANEKIEAFFDACLQNGLTGNQGVILPLSNQRHLNLKEEIIQAVQNEQFHIFAVSHVSEALPLLTNIPYSAPHTTSLISLIQERIRANRKLQAK